MRWLFVNLGGTIGSLACLLVGLIVGGFSVGVAAGLGFVVGIQFAMLLVIVESRDR